MDFLFYFFKQDDHNKEGTWALRFVFCVRTCMLGFFFSLEHTYC